MMQEKMKQTEIGEIPESWSITKIKEIGEVITGSTPSTKNENFYGGEYNLISPADLDNGKYVQSAHRKLTQAGYERCTPVPQNSILVGCIGNIGKLGMINDNYSTTNQQINSVIVNSNYNPHFIYYMLHNCRQRLIQSAAKVTVPILNKKNFENFSIPIPPLSEQKKIATVLSKIEQNIDAKDELIKTIKELKKSMMQHLFTYGTKSEKTKGKTIYWKGWREIKLGEVAVLNYGKSLPKQKRILGDVPVFSSAGLIGKHNEPLVTEPGIIIGRKGTIGSVYKSDISFFPIDTTFYVSKSDTKCDLDFLYYLLKGLALDRLNSDSAVPGLNRNTAYAQDIKIPPLPEQKKIASILSIIDERIENYEGQKSALQALFKSMLNKLMTGQIRVDKLAIDVSELELQ
ncbi:MAG: restriction endonuclease subunit S [Chromatiales bacterium]|nr:restriction endonuclease subunit S [Chromatiales bacterium]